MRLGSGNLVIPRQALGSGEELQVLSDTHVHTERSPMTNFATSIITTEESQMRRGSANLVIPRQASLSGGGEIQVLSDAHVHMERSPMTNFATSIVTADDSLMRRGSGHLVIPRQSVLGSSEEVQVLADSHMHMERSQHSEVHRAEAHSKHHVEVHTGHARYNHDSSASGDHRHSHASGEHGHSDGRY